MIHYMDVNEDKEREDNQRNISLTHYPHDSKFRFTLGLFPIMGIKVLEF
jgi:hypothetical protein